VEGPRCPIPFENAVRGLSGGRSGWDGGMVRAGMRKQGEGVFTVLSSSHRRRDKRPQLPGIIRVSILFHVVDFPELVQKLRIAVIEADDLRKF